MRARWYWLAWGAMTVGAAGYLGVVLTTEQAGTAKRMFLPGRTTDGHYQIELACSTCHTPFAGVKAEACGECHGEELRAVNDTHPKSKFTDPRNAGLAEKLDARTCVTCHREHRPAMTRAMGLTLPDDYCFTCHAEIGMERASHKGLGFDTCASAGCHNYHDNTALYEDFLTAHASEPPLRRRARVPSLGSDLPNARAKQPLHAADADVPRSVTVDKAVFIEWEASAHGRSGVNCSECHGSGDSGPVTIARWLDRPERSHCAGCHSAEVEGFERGKHGMRAAAGLGPMRPAFARRPMKEDSHARELSCASCHSSHGFETRRAAVDACLECHDDRHSIAYTQSPHYQLWKREIEGAAAGGSGVSCATCHLPRATRRADGRDVLTVQHNQNENLRPNEKMLRSVCLNCHGLAFAIDALADRALVDNNFKGAPARHVESIEMAVSRDAPVN